MEASKALLNVARGRGDPSTALTLLKKVKDLLPLWVDNDTLIQTYKRFFNSLLKSSDINLGVALSPFSLISCCKSLEVLMEKKGDLRGSLNNFIPEIFDRVGRGLENRSQWEKDLIDLLMDLLSPLDEEALPFATHMAYLLKPSNYPALTRDMIRSLGIETTGEYLIFSERIRQKGIKPMEAFALLHMLLELSPAKIMFLDEVFGIDRREILLGKAVRLWQEKDFWKAHEVLEDLWCIVDEEDLKNALQGLIRVAIALHHLTGGDRDASLRVLKKALPQLVCDNRTPFDITSLRKEVCELIETLERSEPPKALPTLKML